MANNSCTILLKFKLAQDFMPVLVTNRFDQGSIKIKVSML